MTMSQVRIIAAPDCTGHWNAWLDGTPATAFGGDAPATAVARLLRAYRWSVDQIESLGSGAPPRQLFRVRTDPCPDCQGSGKYVGLRVAEICDRCGGKGVV